jgi:hypothetical protein
MKKKRSPPDRRLATFGRPGHRRRSDDGSQVCPQQLAAPE